MNAGPQQLAPTLKKLNIFVFGALLNASDDVVTAHNQFMRASKVIDPKTRQPDPQMGIPAIADVLLAMRRDAGETSTSLRPIDLMATFTRDIDELTSAFDRWAAEKAKAWPSPPKPP